MPQLRPTISVAGSPPAADASSRPASIVFHPPSSIASSPRSNRHSRRKTVDALNPVAGFIVGVLVGFTGVGGGALMTPLLVFFFGVAPQTAIGTDLLFACITKVFGAWVHG